MQENKLIKISEDLFIRWNEIIGMKKYGEDWVLIMKDGSRQYYRNKINGLLPITENEAKVISNLIDAASK